ncbi:Uncharacterised protein [Klebsiella pneumoniae]|nr:Uncharacterised protein [Klebsiella pneumoniae]
MILRKRRRVVYADTASSRALRQCKTHDVAGNHKLFIGVDHRHFDQRIIRLNKGRAPLVFLVVQREAEKMQIAADRRPRPGGILAYAAGKDQRVQTSHLHDIAADSRANAFGKQRQRQSRPFVAGVGCLFDVAVIRGHAGDAQQPGFIIQQLTELLGGFPFFLHQPGKNRRVDIAAAGAHHHPPSSPRTGE